MSEARWRYVSKTLQEESAAPERTRIQLCGQLSVQIDGVELVGALRGRQVPLLLAYLVLARDRHIGREELSLALWPERAPRAQDAALRTLLSRLRSALGAAALPGREPLMLALPEPVWIDVEAAAQGIDRALEALEDEDAKRAWAQAQVPLNVAGRGLLPGFDAAWLESRRRELEDLRLRALEVVGRAGLLLGGPQLSSAQRAGRALIEAEPYRESGYVLLMQALAAEGNIAEGLRVFERLRTLLREELGTAPSPAAIGAHEHLLHPSSVRPPQQQTDVAAAQSAVPEDETRITVYIAEDHPVFQEAVARAIRARPDLELLGAAADGRTAVDEIRRLRPAVALLDRWLPELDGLEIVRTIERESLPTRVVVLSADSSRGFVHDALNLGTAGFLTKAATLDEICETVAAVSRGETVLSREIQSELVTELRERHEGKRPDSPRRPG